MHVILHVNIIYIYMCVYACVCVCVYVRMCVCVCAISDANRSTTFIRTGPQSDGKPPSRRRGYQPLLLSFTKLTYIPLLLLVLLLLLPFTITVTDIIFIIVTRYSVLITAEHRSTDGWTAAAADRQTCTERSISRFAA